MIDKPDLTPKIARMFRQLIDGEYLTRSQFSSKNAVRWLERLEEVGAVKRQKARIWLANEQRLNNLLKSLGYNEPLESYFQEADLRSRSVKLYADSKTTGTTVFPVNGAYLRSVLLVTAQLGDSQISLNLQGTWFFVHDFQYLRLPSDVTVVWIENLETFSRIQYYPLLNRLRAAFFYTVYTKDFVAWLSSQPNPYLHFGDFDLSGLAIYITEFRRKMPGKQMQFYIPDNLDKLFDLYGKPDLYSNQLLDKRVKNIDFSEYPEISQVIRLIEKYHKGLEQEVLEDLQL